MSHSFACYDIIVPDYLSNKTDLEKCTAHKNCVRVLTLTQFFMVYYLRISEDFSPG